MICSLLCDTFQSLVILPVLARVYKYPSGRQVTPLDYSCCYGTSIYMPLGRVIGSQNPAGMTTTLLQHNSVNVYQSEEHCRVPVRAPKVVIVGSNVTKPHRLKMGLFNFF